MRRRLHRAVLDQADLATAVDILQTDGIKAVGTQRSGGDQETGTAAHRDREIGRVD
jgi:hypothetical protein